MNCPDCGAIECDTAPWGITYACGSESGAGGFPRYDAKQSERCRYVAGLRAIVKPLEELLAGSLEPVTIRRPADLVVTVVTGDCVLTMFDGGSLAEALTAANDARKESDHD